MVKMEDADMGEEPGDFSSKTSRSTTGESMTEDIDMDDYGGYGYSYRMMVFWNLEDFPIPQSAELGSFRPRIIKALALMGFRSCVEIHVFADHLNYGADELCNAGIRWSRSMRPAYMPKEMIVHAQSTTRTRYRERVILFVIANQIPGSELVRVQRCLKSRGYTVIFVDDPSKQCLLQSAQSIFDCTRFVGAEQCVSRSGLDFFSGQKPIGPKRSQELLAEVHQVLKGGGYPAAYVNYVYNLCLLIAMGKKLILKDIRGCIRSISPIDDDLCRVIDEVLCERGFRVSLFPAEDTAKETSPDHFVGLPPFVVEPATWDSHSDPISHDSRKIENFSEPITPVKTVLFWDVVDCPFPVCPPDVIYDRIDKALCKGGYGGEMTIWAYVDENNGPWTAEYLRNKTWDSRIYFLPGGDHKASRLLRMFNDVHLWKLDMVSAVFDLESDYTEFVDVIVVSDQVRGDTEFFSMLEGLSSFDFIESFLVTPTQDVNKPESLEWPRPLLFKNAESLFGPPTSCEREESSPSPNPSPKRQKVDDAAEETP